ncbi:MAG: nucleotidyltransferase domain-containing protein, partial [Bacilli bacterium]|nr:nucleotidyltransferase domain-containing protein [Bacilli bacterium]
MIPQAHQNFIESIKKTLIKDTRITGLLVGGSYLTNDMDEYSDIDFIIVINNEDYEEVFNARLEMIKDYGTLLAAFTGEHVGEPRLVISLYDDP